jgi:SEL1 protein
MTIAFRHYQGIGAPRNCEEAAYYYRRVAEKALNWWDSGPPGGHYLQKHTFRLADDQGGVYGEGASAISSGPNGQRQRQSLDSAKELGDIVEYLELLARKGNLPETMSLGKIYYEGSRNLPRNIPKAKEYFLRVARQYWDRDGKVRAGGPQYLGKYAGRAAGYLGNMELRGEAGPQDYNLAFKWFKRGVTCGDANSQNGLAYMYLNGYGVKEDRNKAATYFKTAAAQDFPIAQVNYAKILLENGEIAHAKRYLELAARHGNVEAFYYLAEINNAAMAKDRSCGLATAYYKIVAEKVEPLQSPMAWANKAYENGDIESALVGYMMAAEQGYESGQANVAYLLDEHRSAFPIKSLLALAGVNPKQIPGQQQISQKDQELALIYWTRSAKQANVDSLVKMGDYYLSGIGTDPDPVKAASCYNAAAEHQASAQALWNLGWMHENGIGVSQDFHLAKRYYDQAFETNPEAYLPVTLSLFKLRVRAFWNTITHGGVKGIGPEPKKKRVTFREFLKNWYEAAAEAEAQVYQEEEELASDQQQHLPGDEYGYEDGFDEDIAESIIILALAGAVAVLVYYRQWRQQQQARRRAEEQRVNGGAPVQQQQVVPPPPVGIWDDPQMPGWGMPH